MIDSLLDAMRFRCIGPPRGGRVVAVAGDPSEPAVFWFGAVAGGIWKTGDAGVTWTNVSDGYLKTSSVGALAVSDSDPNVIWAGTGESTIRGDVSHGDGVYRSTDGGRSWAHLGLADTRHISEIRIHPRDPDRVWVAALGHAFGPNSQRGVFRTTDGGASWERVLYENDRTGAADLALDTRNPTVLYAGLWEAHRNFWELSSGGPGSGLWRSDDGGTTWARITPNLGLPASATLGKIGVAASPARSGRVWALVESDAAPGLYRSEDFGETWTLASDRQQLRHRPWYYMHVFADPRDEDTVYVNNLRMWKSTDAGAHFEQVPTPHGDNHDLWIDPRDNRRMIQGNDGGANVSFNAGASWSSVHNQLTAQLYTVDTDGRAPHYFVYGTQQDNSSIGVPSGANDGAIAWEDCRIAGTGESGYVAVDPKDPDVVYVGAIGSSPGGGGALQRYDHRTGQVRLVNVWPEHHGGMGPGELRYRFGWTFPIRFSPHDPNVLYAGGNRLFRSTDEGQSWEPVSPDLTRADPDKLGPSGGPITRDTSGAEHYCTLSTFAESPHEPGVLWAGSDDGLVHLSRDGGRSWRDVTPPDLPEWAFIRTVEPSPHDPAALYLAATRYKLDDNAPYLCKTADYGESWQSITGSEAGPITGSEAGPITGSEAGAITGSEAGPIAGSEAGPALPGDDFVRVVRADPGCRGVLYVGTETGLHVSLDDGATWRRWRSNFPVTPVYDLKVEGTDLVVATHGRSFWIVDDLTPLHREAAAGARDDSELARLYAPRRAWRLLPGVMDFITSTEGKDYSIGLGRPATSVATRDDSGQVRRAFLDAGEAAPAGVVVYYSLPEGRLEGRPAAPAAGGTSAGGASAGGANAGGAGTGGANAGGAGTGGTSAGGTSAAPASTAVPGASGSGDAPAPSVSIAFHDSGGALVREFRPKPAGWDGLDEEDRALDPGPWMPARAGVNRFVWDLRFPGAMRLRGNRTGEEADRGPLVLPGAYEVRLRIGERTLAESFEVVNDPRSPASIDDLREQLDCLLAIRDRISDAYAGVRRIRDTSAEVERWCARLARHGGHEAAVEAGSALREALAAVESALILPGEQTDSFGLHHRVRLNAALASVIGVMDSADARPTVQARALAREYMARIDAELERLKALLDHDLRAFNDLVSEAGLPAVDAP